MEVVRNHNFPQRFHDFPSKAEASQPVLRERAAEGSTESGMAWLTPLKVALPGVTASCGSTSQKAAPSVEAHMGAGHPPVQVRMAAARHDEGARLTTVQMRTQEKPERRSEEMGYH